MRIVDLRGPRIYLLGHHIHVLDFEQVLSFNSDYHGEAVPYQTMEELRLAVLKRGPVEYRTMFFKQDAPWDKDIRYRAGDTVQYYGRKWVALPDVAAGFPPDDVYEEDDDGNFTGGWLPHWLTLEPPDDLEA